MAQADHSWVTTLDDEDVYVKAQAFGADKFVLSSKRRAYTFVQAKTTGDAKQTDRRDSILEKIAEDLEDVKNIVRSPVSESRVEVPRQSESSEQYTCTDGLSPWSYAKQKEFKRELVQFYRRRGWLTSHIKCMVTNEWHKKKHIMALQIWKPKNIGSPKERNLAHFGLPRSDISSPKNGLLLLEDIGAMYDKKHICFLYDSFQQTFYFKVLNPNLLTTKIAHSTKTFGDINGCILAHPEKKHPYRRLLNFHAKLAFQLARDSNWITEKYENEFKAYLELSDHASIPDKETLLL